MKKHIASTHRQSGLTLVEVAVSVTVFMLLVGSVLSIAVETSNFIGDTDVDYSVQTEVNRSQLRLAEVLRKSGPNSVSGTSYPVVINSGSELQFRLLTDLDGNGHPFDATTGQLEWGGTVYSIRLDAPTRTLSIYNGPNPVRVLGRFVDSVSFATYIEDNTLQLKEVRVSIAASKQLKSGQTVQHASTFNVFMRN